MKHAFGALAIGSGLWIGSAQARELPKTLASCLEQVSQSAETALDQAQYWQHHGGGQLAQQCMAQAWLELGQYRNAASFFDQLSHENLAGKGGEALVQENDFAIRAAEAWLLAEEGQAAEASAQRALSLRPDDPYGHFLLARSLALRSDWAGVLRTLGNVDSAPNDLKIKSLVLRAAARRYLGQLQAGMSDVQLALGLDPDNVDALLERGIANVRLGHFAAARTDWDRVIALSPDGHEAYLARQDEAVLDADPEEP